LITLDKIINSALVPNSRTLDKRYTTSLLYKVQHYVNISNKLYQLILSLKITDTNWSFLTKMFIIVLKMQSASRKDWKNVTVVEVS